MNDVFENRLQTAMRSLSSPAAPPDLIARVIAERAAGKRIILPTSTPSSRFSRVARIGWVMAVAAALAIVMALPHAVRRMRGDAAADSVSSSDDFFVSRAFAEQGARGPAYPPLHGLTGVLIRPGRYQYRIRYVDSAGNATPDGEGTIDITRATSGGTATLRIAHVASLTADDGQRRTEAESLVVALADLSVRSRVVHVRPYRRFSEINIAQRIVSDSLLGQMTTDDGIHRSIARRLPANYGPFIPDAIAAMALAGVRLAPDWRASVSVLGWGVIASDVYFPVSLRVVGDERLTTPRGVFDCWKLAVDARGIRRTEWVRKSDGLALRVDGAPATLRGIRRLELTVF